MVLTLVPALVNACHVSVVPAALCVVEEPTLAPRTQASERADELLQRWAPAYVQRVDARDHGADRPTRIDFDGDWDTTNNWDHQADHGAAVPPAAYGAAVLTDTHAYLTYTLYYPRDWNRGVCVPLICHDNDLETVMVVVERTGATEELVEIRTKAHFAIGETRGAEVMRTADGHPLLNVEPEGHGIAVCRTGDRRCDARRGRIVYVPAVPGAPPAVPPMRAEGQTVAYALLPLRDTLWARRALDRCRLWTGGETGPLAYAGRHHGRLGEAMGAAMAGGRYAGGVRPPWALKGAIGTRGDWFFDPAGSGTYAYNPFLDDLRAECAGEDCIPARAEPSRLRRWLALTGSGAPLSRGRATLDARMRRRAADARSVPHTPPPSAPAGLAGIRAPRSGGVTPARRSAAR